MKIFIASLCLFALILSGTILYNIWFNAQTGLYQEALESIYDQVNQEDYGSASRSFDDLLEKLVKDDRILSLFIHHSEMYETLNMMERLEVYIAEQEKTDALSEANTIKQHIKNMNKNEQLSISNIF